jgi:hypothetical protein
MRSRIMSTFVAAAAAGVTATTLGLAVTGAASAAVATKAQAQTIGPAIGSTSSAGYEASGRNFRYIASTITVPDTSFLTGLFPSEYIQLSNGSLTQPTGGGDTYTRAGIESCVVARSFGDTCITGTWVAFVEAFNNSLSGPFFSHFFNLAGVNQGDGVNFSIYFDQAGNELHYVITPPSTSGTPQFYKTRAFGPLYDHAAALDDFTDSTGTPIALPPFVRSFRINQFLQGALTTYSGARGSFVGPWTTSPVIATSNGLLPPSGTTRVSPSALWSDGLLANGAVRSNDAFGVWAR